MSPAARDLPTSERLAALVETLPSARVTVMGDPVLDEFLTGEIQRVSREAPVLILEHRGDRHVPGGAANAAANLASLGVPVALVGRVGHDAAGRRLRRLLDRLGVNVERLVAEKGLTTPVKSRVLAGGAHTAKQQIVRIDRGTRAAPPTGATRRSLTAAARAARKRGEALLLADYGYGVVEPGIASELGGAGEGLVFLDSRFRVGEYRGVSAATPNVAELESALDLRLDDEDDEAVLGAGAVLRRRLGAEAVLVTRGSRGMALCRRRRRGVLLPVFGSDEVADVTGAGDTVIAAFAAARAAGADWVEAAALSNVAGGLVVMKRGTATLTRREILRALRHGPPRRAET
jgi:rfaE bifunctional protein kinase chain/domain